MADFFTILLALSFIGCDQTPSQGNSTNTETTNTIKKNTAEKNTIKKEVSKTSMPSNVSNVQNISNQPLPPLNPVGSGIFKQEAPKEQSQTENKAICNNCNVILITFCSLRKDHVSLYGSEYQITPELEKLGRKGQYFSQAYSASNFTLAGLTSILTGKFGSATGVTGWDKGLVKDIPTLPEILGFYGYETAGFTIDSASGFRPDYGLNKGFQHFQIDRAPAKTPDGRDIFGEYVKGAAILPAMNWLQNRIQSGKNSPFFLMFHSRTAHFPFVIENTTEENDPTGLRRMLFEAGKPTGQTQQKAMPGMAGGQINQGVSPGTRDPLQILVDQKGEVVVEVWKETYREAVERMDGDLFPLLEIMDRHQLWNNTIVVVVADHGESLNDHRELLHGDSFYQGVINVPMVVYIPDLEANKQQDALVSHVDILPTILESVGAMEPAGIDGRSMLGLMQSKTEKIRDIALSEGGVAQHNQDNLSAAIISPPWTLLRQRSGCGESRWPPGTTPVCLYNIETDPEQKNSLAFQKSNIVSDLTNKWNLYKNSHQSNQGVPLHLSKEFIQELQNNGYNFESPQ